jgi:CubicO group peptidase (beta-lactamase class C family)
LFNPLGMRHVTLELDGAGTIQGTTGMLASARDWARFGLLYLSDGMVGGKHILNENWVDFCADARQDTDYGAGFRTNRSEHDHAKGCVRGFRAMLPAHLHHFFSAHGHRALRGFGRSPRRYPRHGAAEQGGDRGPCNRFYRPTW